MTKIIQVMLTVSLIITILACASMPGMPGYIRESISKFDGSKQISMEPAWLYNSPIKLALFKNTKMPDSTVMLIAVVTGAHNFARGKSLHLNIDGNIESYASIDDFTDIETTSGYYGSSIGVYIPGSNWSSKRYIVSKEVIYRLINAKDAWVKIDLSKEYVEGRFSSDAPTTARPAFREFYRRIAQW